MKKIDETIIKETKYIAVCIFLLSLLFQAVFLVIGRWDYTVLLGNLYSALLGVANFFVMGLYVQKALSQDEKQARSTIKLSQTGRQFVLLVLTIVGVVLPYFNIWSVLIPLLFPNFAIRFRPLLKK